MPRVQEAEGGDSPVNVKVGKLAAHLGITVIWMRWNGSGWALRSPLCPVLFSERFGSGKPVARACGWRIVKLREGN